MVLLEKKSYGLLSQGVQSYLVNIKSLWYYLKKKVTDFSLKAYKVTLLI